MADTTTPSTAPTTGDASATVPTALPTVANPIVERRDIVILGASFGGLSVAHYLARHVLPRLQKVDGVKYDLHLVDPTTKFWWRLAAPREIVSVKDAKHEDYFFPIMDGFAQYKDLKDSIFFHHARADAIDTSTRTLSLITHDGAAEKLPYYALVIATGTRSPTPLTTLHGDYTITQKALEETNAKLATAKEIVVAGGGPTAVETTGEIAARYGKQAKVTLVAGSDKLLPVLRKALADKAQKQLEKLGVEVRYNTKVTSSNVSAEGKTELVLADGSTITADVYIPAFGVTPNTDFLPAEFKTEKGYIKANQSTLRIDEAGPRVYAAGDVAGVDAGGILAMQETVPVVGANIAVDLFRDAAIKSNGSKLAERTFVRKDRETQVVPVGPKGGVGAFNGIRLPGFIVSLAKGKDYLKGQIKTITHGTKWSKA